jgi:hypothetical protein
MVAIRSSDQPRVRLAGQHVVDRWGVDVAWMRERAQEGDLVGVLGQQRHVLADVDAGHAGPNRLEQAADALRGVGLQVPQVNLGRPAPQEQVDARSSLAGAPGDRSSSHRALGAQQAGQSQGAETELAQADHGIAALEHRQALCEV